MNPIRVRLDEQDRRILVEVTGELCVSTAPQLDAVVSELRLDRARRLHLDLSGVDFCDLAGMRMISAIRSRCAREGVRVRVRQSPALRGLARIVDAIAAAHAA